ncbi:MAG: Hpt domain-containing protein [Planctomycetes bacterium]|nr:Hpt domain-containing protein [Planctomycetota bacterium]
MTLDTSENGAIYSNLAADPDFGELVEMYVEEMDDRITVLQESHDCGDQEKLRTAAHQMKGAAGSYGFEQLTPLAATLEYSVRDNKPEETILESLRALISACRQVRAGTPD